MFSEKAEKDRLETELLALDKKSGELREAIDEAQEKSKENITFLSTRIDTRKKEASEKETLLKSLNDQLEAKTAALGANTERKDELSSEIQETKKKIAEVEKEIEHSRNRLRTFALSLPGLEGKISQVRASIENEKQREADGKRSLLTYESTTKIYAQHFDVTLEALQKYMYSRPWLEKGEKLSVPYLQYDFQAGFLGLPVGLEHGIEIGMIFSVRAKGKRLCRIKINDVSSKNSVGMIIPLFGNPVELRKFKSLISFICRLLAWLATIGLGVYLILSPSSSSSVSSKIQAAEQELTDLQLQLEVDKNSSEKEEFELSRSAQEYSAKIEDATAQSEKLSGEIAGLASRAEQLDSEISEKSKELEVLKEALGKARSPLDEIEEQSRPLVEKENADKATLKNLEAELLAQKQKADAVSGELAVLQQRRSKAFENFNSAKERLSVDVKKPYHLHFAQKKEVNVRNKVPSGKGIFIDAGYEDGLRDGMEFLVERMNDQNALPFRARLGLVQDRYSYLEFLHPDDTPSAPPSLEQEERILLTRSGEVTPSTGLGESNSTQ